MPDQENQNNPQGQNQQNDPQNSQDQEKQTPGYNDQELSDRQTGTAGGETNQQDTAWRPSDDSAVETPPSGQQSEGEPGRSQADTDVETGEKSRSQGSGGDGGY